MAFRLSIWRGGSNSKDMTQDWTLRLARPEDIAAVDRLLGRSYPRLLRADYAPSIMVSVVPMIARARQELLSSRRYFVVEGRLGHLVGAGGYSMTAPGPRGGPLGAAKPRVGHIRHVATDPDVTRQGVGRMLMRAVFAAAAAEGVMRFECLSTLTAVPFYQAMGFVVDGPGTVQLGPGLEFPVMRMSKGA